VRKPLLTRDQHNTWVADFKKKDALAGIIKPATTVPRPVLKRRNHWNEDEYDLEASRKPKERAARKKARRKTVADAATKLAVGYLERHRETLRAEYREETADRDAYCLHDEAFRQIDELDDADMPEILREYLMAVLTVSGESRARLFLTPTEKRGGRSIAQAFIEDLPDAKLPPDSKRYLLDHLLRTFEDTERLRAFRLTGPGKRLPHKERNNAIAAAVEKVIQYFDLDVKSACKCVSDATEWFKASLSWSRINEVYDELKETDEVSVFRKMNDSHRRRWGISLADRPYLESPATLEDLRDYSKWYGTPVPGNWTRYARSDGSLIDPQEMEPYAPYKYPTEETKEEYMRLERPDLYERYMRAKRERSEREK
jgi:hypothetical protein